MTFQVLLSDREKGEATMWAARFGELSEGDPTLVPTKAQSSFPLSPLVGMGFTYAPAAHHGLSVF